MTEEHRKLLAEDPGRFLKGCRHHAQWIRLKLEEIRYYRELAESITAEIKAVATFSLTPSRKVENCVMEMVTIQEDIQKKILEFREDLAAVQEAIDLLDDETQKLLMDARYVRHMTWEEISILISCSYRWTLRLHGQALKKISEKAMLIHV